MARPKPLHIAASLRVIARHKHVPGISLQAAREIIQGAAAAPSLSREEQSMVDDLERTTGVPLAELAELTKRWLPRS